MDLDKIVSELKRERDRIDRALSALADRVSATSATRGIAAGSSKRGKGLSAAGRRRLSEAMKARWAAGKFKKKAAAPAAARATKRHMSPAARKRIAAAVKKRWAEKKAIAQPAEGA